MSTENINIFEVDEKNFQTEVIDASDNGLILVDFWAPWCEPCKQLTPILTEIANENNGGVKVAKINIDENQQIAGQLKIQSIPAVFAVYKKKIVDAFQGVLPKEKIIQFIEKNLGEKITEDFSEFFNGIKKLNDEKNYNEIKNSLESFLAENSENVEAISLYIDCLVNLVDFKNVNIFIESLSENTKKDPIIISSLAKLEIIKKNTDESPIDDLLKELKKSPKKIETIVKISEKYFSNNDYEKAFEILLESFQASKKENKKIIKETLLKFFEALGNTNEHTKHYRKKLSSIMFA
jgi:putative thioredoxin